MSALEARAHRMSAKATNKLPPDDGGLQPQTPPSAPQQGQQGQPQQPVDGQQGGGYKPKPYSESADEDVVCPRCHKLNEPDSVFCDQCGFKLAGAQGVQVRGQGGRQQQLPHGGPLGSQTPQDQAYEESQVKPPPGNHLPGQQQQVPQLQGPPQQHQQQQAQKLLGDIDGELHKLHKGRRELERLQWQAINDPNAGVRLAAQTELRARRQGQPRDQLEKSKRGVVMHGLRPRYPYGA